MKTPVLYLRTKHTKELLDWHIKSNIATCSSCIHIHHKYEITLVSLLQNLCYKVFFVNVKFTPEQRYSISDACQYIDGMFRDDMIQTLHEFVAYSYDKDTKHLKSILRDCLSYEILQMLYSDPVKVYACILGLWCFEVNDMELLELCDSYAENKSEQPTLDWERLYLFYMERYENV